MLALLTVSAGRAAEARYAAIVIDADTGEVLHETNADTRNFPASLTKMMTLYLLFEALERGEVTLSTKLKVSAHAAKQQPSKLGLKSGSTITVENAIKGLVTKSANDVAVVVAEALGKTESGFAKKMTAKAQALGMTRTAFYNASGLPDKRQVSTARDMAKLSVALMENFPQYYHYFSLRSFRYGGQTYPNHNRLLGAYSGVDGIKTGYTRASGYNISVSAVRDGRRLIAVIFGGNTSKERNNKATALMNAAFAGTGKSPPKTQEVKKAPPAPPPEKPATVVAALGNAGTAAAAAAAPSTGSSSLVQEVEIASANPVTPAQVAALGTSLDETPPSGWAIQVGAFSQSTTAHQTARGVTDWAPDPLASARIYVMEIEKPNGKLYRARLVDLSENDARQACKALSKQKIDCLVVAPGN